MSSFEDIKGKLETFTRKFYTKQFIQGIILFTLLTSILGFLVIGVEYLLWLPGELRLGLFYFGLVVLLYLIYRYILVPVFFLLRIRKGITNKEASNIIGEHFPEVRDKLRNLLDLNDSKESSELLIAAIEQSSKNLNKVSFTDAVKLKDGLKKAKVLVFPMGVLLILWATGSIVDFFNSAERVVNYDMAYEPPAPFKFVLSNNKLKVLEDKPFTVTVNVIGTVRPEFVNIDIDGEPNLMRHMGNGQYAYTFNLPLKNCSFRFIGGGVTSREYTLEVLKVPSIVDFTLEVQQPTYLGGLKETVKGTGSLSVPEGTKLSWKLQGLHTEVVKFITKDTVRYFNKDKASFSLAKTAFTSFNYGLATSNKYVVDYESLNYNIDVIKDTAPKIKVEMAIDSLTPNLSYFSGTAIDDHGLVKVDLVYYEAGKEETANRVQVAAIKDNYYDFYYTFPGDLALDAGKPYALYFEVWDNDGLRGGKATRSTVFRTTLLGNKDLKDNRLQKNKELYDTLHDELFKYQDQQDLLEEINAKQKQEEQLSFSNKEKLKDFLNQQQHQEALMEKFSKELKENLKKEKGLSEQDQLLKERLERQELAAKKQQKLLAELQKVADKIKKEELQQKLDQLAKKQKSNKRNLQQLLELTKKYYVMEKAAQLGKELDLLSKEQELLSKTTIGEDYDADEQLKLNKKFEQLAAELRELKGDSRSLRKPIELGFGENQVQSIKNDQKQALDAVQEHEGADNAGVQQEIQENAQKKAANKQLSAAQKMKALSEALQAGSSAGGGGSDMVEDAEMLRQVLDNLVQFSFKQEDLMEEVNQEGVSLHAFSNTIIKQKELRRLFEHVDDSLFSLSLRRAELSEFVNEQIEEVYYNVDKALDNVAENQMYQAASYQQYVVNAANNLADFLANVLDNMQQSMSSGQGQGQGEGFQLPDIIKGQQAVKEQMEGGGKPKGGEQGESPSGEKQGQGEQGESGKDGEQGQQDEQGQQGGMQGSGQQGETGGNQGNNGKQGQDNGKGEGQVNGSASENKSETAQQNQKGRSGAKGSDGEGQGEQLSEQELAEIYEIYQQQQAIRTALEKQLKDMINKDERAIAKKLSLQMAQFENELLENGITARTITKVNQIQHQLLKLENAALQQGKKKTRKSTANDKKFRGITQGTPAQYFQKSQERENLNRQALPLRIEFMDRVKDYFKQKNDL